MADVTLGIAPDSWGVWFADDPRQPPWRRYLDEVAEAGFTWTELGPFGYLPTQVDVLGAELDARGLQLVAGAAMFDLADPAAGEQAAAEVEETCALVAALGGAHLLVIDDVYTDLFTGAPLRAPELDDAGWSRLLDAIARLADVAGQHGLELAFHPHAQTHVEYEPQIERLLEDAPDLSLCLDVGHHAYCGGDPVAFFAAHAERVSLLHLKSVDGALRDRVLRDGVPFAQAVGDGVFVEPSHGIVDFAALRDTVSATGFAGFAIVEQDMYPADFDAPLPIAKRTREHLRGLGWA
jgi:inosose dehydratase